MSLLFRLWKHTSDPLQFPSVKKLESKRGQDVVSH